MPWYALPHACKDIKIKLSGLFKIRGIPSLIIMDGESGNFITDNGRVDIMQTHGKPKSAVMSAMERWSNMEAVPAEQARLAASDPWYVVLMKNPIIFVIIYWIYQFFTKKA